MLEHLLSPDFLPAATTGAWDMLAQAQSDPFGPQQSSPGFGLGTIVFLMVIGIGVNVLFGLWAKSRGEEHGVNPLMAFCCGFFLGWIGVLIVPVLRTDRIVNTRRPPPNMPPPPHAQNPMYMNQQGAYPPAPQGGPPPGAYQQQGGYAPPPGPMLTPGAQPQQAPPPPPQPAQQMLVADEHGYVQCPYCAARTKAGRKACMSCGNFLPAIYDPNAGK